MTAEFELHLLGWSDFQALCHTVAREIFGQTVVGYLDQDDGGRDGAFYGTWTPAGLETFSGDFVFQAKHTSVANASLSLSDLEDELDKAERLNRAGRCDVWVLMTNARVSGRTEEKITAAIRERGVPHALVLGTTWINQTIAESARLRMLVPRLYGLGDLTQILDERAYRQATAVLEGMRTDLAKLVRTETYERAAAALDSHGFVLLVGAPATGKTTIAAQLSLAAADAFDTHVLVLDDATQFTDRWNPHERQLFWLDDAFGATQLDPFLAFGWQRMTPKIGAAIDGGSKFVLTTRDYILRRAWSHLKPGSFPLLDGAQVIVDVTDLTLRERRQILYNHLKHGRQPGVVVRNLRPLLEGLASHPGFTPELARRLADPAFTQSLTRITEQSLHAFFDRPKELLADIFAGLDRESLTALGLIFLGRGWLPSPVVLGPTQEDLVERLGGSLAGVIAALDEMDESLVVHVTREGATGWVFTHPTMIDAFADILRRPEFIHLLVEGFSMRVLMAQTTCGDVGIEKAIELPERLWPAVIDRLAAPLEPDEAGWGGHSRRLSYVGDRCAPEFQRLFLERKPEVLDRLAEPGLMLDADSDNLFMARLQQNGILPEEYRAYFAGRMIELCVGGTDSGVLTSRALRGMLTEAEDASLRSRILSEVVLDPHRVLAACVDGVYGNDDPESLTFPVMEYADALEAEFPGDEAVQRATATIRSQREEWVFEHRSDDERDEPAVSSYHAISADQTTSQTERSIFDDLVE